MKQGEHIAEPLLEFGLDQHIDIRIGIRDFRPADYQDEKRPKVVNVGVVGTPETIDGFCGWLDQCREEVGGKETKKHRLFPSFPGFRSDAAFESTIQTDQSIQSTIMPRELMGLKSITDRNERTKAACDLFLNRIEHISRKRVSLIVCILPPELLEVIDIEDTKSGALSGGHASSRRYNLHDMLKARSLMTAVPIQLVRPGTFDRKLKRKEVDDFGKRRQLQDDATIAWNFFTALYYKAGGFPWKLVRHRADLSSCHVGISFFETLERKKLHTSLAQIFDERGHGLIVQGGEVSRDKDDRQPRMDRETAYSLVKQALESYRLEHRTMPARVVFHKSSKFSATEVDGIHGAAQDLRISVVDLMSVAPSQIRLARDGYYPPLRGSWFNLDDQRVILYTNGSVAFYEEYPGLYVPRSLLMRFDQVESSRDELIRETLALTKMNWNNSQITALEPVTLRAARQIGAIMKYVDTPPKASTYRYFM